MMRLFFILLFSFIIHQNGWGQSCYNPDVDQDGHINTIDLLGLLAMYDQSFIADCDSISNACEYEESLFYNDDYYDIVAIGDQCWFAENLRTDKYSNGNAINYGFSDTQWSNATSGYYCAWNHDENPIFPWGYIYNYYAINDVRNICPSGWHVPLENDWIQLETYLGIDSSELYLEYEWRGSTQGEQLKNNTIWDGTDTYGLNLVPGVERLHSGGWYPNPQPSGFDYYDDFFTQSSMPSADYTIRLFQTGNSKIYRYNSNLETYGMNVRCVKN